MSDAPPPSAVPRMVARTVAVFLAYFAYRAPGDEEIPAGIAIGIGVLALGWAGVDAYFAAGNEKRAARVAAQSLVGAAAIGLGIALW